MKNRNNMKRHCCEEALYLFFFFNKTMASLKNEKDWMFESNVHRVGLGGGGGGTLAEESQNNL